MTIISEGPLCLKIHLNRLELQHYFKSYEEINYKNPVVRQTVERLLALAAESFEFEKNGSITTELYPTGSGGCVFRFTCEPAPRCCAAKHTQAKYLKEQSEELAFEFNCCEHLLSAFQAAGSTLSRVAGQSSLYSKGQSFYLLVALPQHCHITCMLREFCSEVLPQCMLKPLLGEHFHCILANHAVQTLSQAF